MLSWWSLVKSDWPRHHQSYYYLGWWYSMEWSSRGLVALLDGTESYLISVFNMGDSGERGLTVRVY